MQNWIIVIGRKYVVSTQSTERIKCAAEQRKTSEKTYKKLDLIAMCKSRQW